MLPASVFRSLLFVDAIRDSPADSAAGTLMRPRAGIMSSLHDRIVDVKTFGAFRSVSNWKKWGALASFASVRGAEIILRVGAAIGGWLVLFTHALIVAVLPVATCDSSSDEGWRGTLLLAGVTAVAALFMGLGLRWRSSLKWPAVLVLPLALYDLSWVVPTLVTTTVGESPLCATFAMRTMPTAAPSDVERVWPVVQSAVLALVVFQAVRYWLPLSSPSRHGDDGSVRLNE